MVTQSSYNVSAAGPVAGTVLSTLPNLILGHIYQVTCYAYYTGTVTAADQDNIGLYVDGNIADTLLLIGQAGGASESISPQRFIHLTTTGIIQLRAIANAGVAAVYHTNLVVQDIGTEVEQS